MSVVQCRGGRSEIELKFPEISDFRLLIDPWMVHEPGPLTRVQRQRVDAKKAAHKPSTSMVDAEDARVNVYVT